MAILLALVLISALKFTTN